MAKSIGLVLTQHTIGIAISAALAYLGDARHALYVRRMLVEKGICKSGELNEASDRTSVV